VGLAQRTKVEGRHCKPLDYTVDLIGRNELSGWRRPSPLPGTQFGDSSRTAGIMVLCVCPSRNFRLTDFNCDHNSIQDLQSIE
jgi:hypothetical protein